MIMMISATIYSDFAQEHAPKKKHNRLKPLNSSVATIGYYSSLSVLG